MMQISKCGAVVIGRNEGERLRHCLNSLLGGGLTIVYVDSNSVDGSAALARSLGAEVVQLDLSRPFTAAELATRGSGDFARSTPRWSSSSLWTAIAR